LEKNREGGEKFWKRGTGSLNFGKVCDAKVLFRGLFDYNDVVLGFLEDDVC